MPGSSPRNPRKKRKQVLESCRKLLEKIAPKFAQGQDVCFDDVKDLYQDRNAFYRDGKTIERVLEEGRELLKPLGVPVPPVKNVDGRLRIPVREFVTRASPEQLKKRLELAAALLDCKYKKSFLVPRTGSIYLGFGTTILAIAQRLYEQAEQFREVAISTSNIEVLMHYYVLASVAMPFQKFSVMGCGKVDWHHGSIILNEEHKDSETATSIVSFETMDREGNFYADTQRRSELVNTVIDKTTRRIILVGEHAKFKREMGFGFPISLPSGINCEVILFTDKRPSSRSFKLPACVKVACPN